MNGLIIKVLSISIAVVTVVYLIIYKGNTMITKIFSVCIIAAMVIYWIVYERNTRKRKKQELQRDDYLFAKENDLPLQINWNEINDFLSDSGYGVNMPMENWFMMDWAIQPCVENGIKEGKFSMKGFRVFYSQHTLADFEKKCPILRVNALARQKMIFFPLRLLSTVRNARELSERTNRTVIKHNSRKSP